MRQPSNAERERILEHNLCALFTRAWKPVPIREGFEQQVRHVALARLPRTASPGRVWPRLLLAGAAAFLVGFFLFAAWERSDFARERLVERGEVALREPRGAWHAAGLAGDSSPALALADRALEFEVPADRALAIALADGGALAVLGPAAASCTPSGGGATLEMRQGRLSLRAFHGRVQGEFGQIECTGVDLDLGVEGACVQALLSAGLARAENGRGRREELRVGRLFDSCPPPAEASGSETVVGLQMPQDPARSTARPPGASSPRRPTTPSAALSGRVRDSEGGAVPAFRVILLRELDLPRVARPSSHEFAAESGSFQVDVTESGNWTVSVQAQGHALWTREHLRLGFEPVQLDVQLVLGERVRGRVIDARDGSPLAGAVVISESDVPGMLLPFDVEECELNPAAVVRTDAQGRFQFEHLAAASTVLRGVHRGLAPQWSAHFVPASGSGEIELSLNAGGALAGRVERDDGSAWAGVGVVSMPQRALFEFPRRSHGQALTDGDGRYRIEDLPAGECVVVRVEATQSDGRVPGRANGELPRTEVRQSSIVAGQTTTQDFLASPRASRWAGRVLGPDGRGMGAATISIQPRDADQSSASAIPQGWRSQLTSVDGGFEFIDVAPGSYSVYLGVRSPMDVVEIDSIEIAPSANLARDVHPHAGSLAGHLRDARDASPLAFAALVIERERSGDVPQFVAKVFSDDSGAWHVPFLEPGGYRIRAFPGHGLASAARGPVELRDGAALTDLDFELSAGCEVNLRLRDELGAPRPGVDVRVFDEQGNDCTPAQFVRTDARGTCKLSGLPKGRARLILRSQDGTRAERELSLQGPEPLDLELEFALPRK